VRERDRITAAASVLAWAGVAAFLVCLLVRMVAPYPRWDLLGCMSVSAVAAAVWWLRACGRSTPGGGAADFPGRGGKGTSRWWPARRGVLVSVAFIALYMPFEALSASASATTPTLAAIISSGPRIATVTIKKVHYTHRKTLKSVGTYFVSGVTVKAPGPDHATDERLEGTVEQSDPPRPGDRVGALYAPDNPEAGSYLGRLSALRSLLGGPAPPGEFGLLALYGLVPLVLARLSYRTATTCRPIDDALGEGQPHTLRVRVEGATAGSFHRPFPSATQSPRLAPGLRLSSPGGSRDLLHERCLDPEALANALSNQHGWLYWVPMADHRPEWVTDAVLVLDDGRYLCGVTPLGEAPHMLQGEPLGGPLPGPEPSRAIGPYALWHSRVHLPAAVAYAVSFLAVGLIAAGAGYRNGTLESLCFSMAAAGPIVGLLSIRFQRQRYLRELRRRTGGLTASVPNEGNSA